MAVDIRRAEPAHYSEKTVDEREVDSVLVGIVQAAAAGESWAWEELTRRFAGSIMASARSCRLCEADAWEVQQTTWLRLVENIGRIQKPERVGSWIATTARRECLRLIRLRSRVSFDDDAIARSADVSIPSADSGPIAEEQARLVRKAFEQLPPKCQRLLAFLSGDDALPYKDISEALSMPIGSIGPTRGRCLEHLRRIIEEIEPGSELR